MHSCHVGSLFRGPYRTDSWNGHQRIAVVFGSCRHLLGLFSSLGPSLIFNVGFDRLPAGINTLLISLGPIFTAIVAHFVFADERFNLLKALGLIAAYGGVIVLAAGSIDDGGNAWDILLVLLGSCIGERQEYRRDFNITS